MKATCCVRRPGPVTHSQDKNTTQNVARLLCREKTHCCSYVSPVDDACAKKKKKKKKLLRGRILSVHTGAKTKSPGRTLLVKVPNDRRVVVTLTAWLTPKLWSCETMRQSSYWLTHVTRSELRKGLTLFLSSHTQAHMQNTWPLNLSSSTSLPVPFPMALARWSHKEAGEAIVALEEFPGIERLDDLPFCSCWHKC